MPHRDELAPFAIEFVGRDLHCFLFGSGFNRAKPLSFGASEVDIPARKGLVCHRTYPVPTGVILMSSTSAITR